MACSVCGCPGRRWLSVGVVAAQFGCGAKRVRRMIRRGELDAVRVGREWRIDHESLDDLIRRSSVRFAATDR